MHLHAMHFLLHVLISGPCEDTHIVCNSDWKCTWHEAVVLSECLERVDSIVNSAFDVVHDVVGGTSHDDRRDCRLFLLCVSKLKFQLNP